MDIYGVELPETTADSAVNSGGYATEVGINLALRVGVREVPAIEMEETELPLTKE